PCRKEVNIRFERGLEGFVPIHEVGEEGKCLRVEGVQSRAEDIGNSPLVHKRRHLRLAHRQFAAVLYLHVLHWEAIGEKAIRRLGPLDDIDKLLLQEVTNAHSRRKRSSESITLGLRGLFPSDGPGRLNG